MKNNKEENVRIETDFLGVKEIQKEAYYGIQTIRAAENFPITGYRIHEELIKAMAIVKKSAALANMEVGRLNSRLGRVIVKAAQEIIEGKLHEQFIIDPIQGGAGTSIMMAVMADEEFRRTKKRFAMGKHEGILKGQWIQGRPPIGYQRNEETKKLEFVEEEAKTVRRIFELAEDNGLIQIAEKMIGFKSRNGKPFSKTSIHRIVHNPIYTGLLQYSTKRGDVVTCENAHEGIVSEEQWDRVQENLKQRTSGDLAIRHRNRNEVHSLLSGLVFCMDCGRKMRVKKDSKQKNTIYLNPCECKGNKGVRESLLLATFQHELASMEKYFREQWEKALNNDLGNDIDSLVFQ